MILVISGTNRKNSKTRIIADHVFEELKSKGENVKLLALDEVEWGVIVDTMYTPDQHHPSLRKIDEELIIPSARWVVISPEYNGSIPGILKLLIDAVSTFRYGDTFAGKKALLIGVSSGRAGNLRGLEHLTGFLHYLKIHVFPQKLPISSIEKVLGEEMIVNEDTQKAISAHLDGFLAH